MARLIDFSDEEISNAVHFIEGQEDSLEGFEQKAWARIKAMIINTAEQQREVG